MVDRRGRAQRSDRSGLDGGLGPGAPGGEPGHTGDLAPSHFGCAAFRTGSASLASLNMVFMLRATDSLPVLPAVIAVVAGATILLLARIVRIQGVAAGLCWLALLASVGTMALGHREASGTEPTRPTVSAIAQDSLARGSAWMALLLGAGCAFLTANGQRQRSTTRHAARYSIV